jgi:lactoylglutathione lyase
MSALCLRAAFPGTRCDGITMFKQPDYIIVYVSDMTRSVAFYRDVLGLTLKFESPGWSEFITGTSTRALHIASTPAAPPRTDQKEQRAGRCELGFSVADCDKAHAELSAKGVRFVLPPTAREGEGIKLAVGLDPDGLPLGFAQLLGAPPH